MLTPSLAHWNKTIHSHYFSTLVKLYFCPRNAPWRWKKTSHAFQTTLIDNCNHRQFHALATSHPLASGPEGPIPHSFFYSILFTPTGDIAAHAMKLTSTAQQSASRPFYWLSCHSSQIQCKCKQNTMWKRPWYIERRVKRWTKVRVQFPNTLCNPATSAYLDARYSVEHFTVFPFLIFISQLWIFSQTYNLFTTVLNITE